MMKIQILYWWVHWKYFSMFKRDNQIKNSFRQGKHSSPFLSVCRKKLWFTKYFNRSSVVEAVKTDELKAF